MFRERLARTFLWISVVAWESDQARIRREGSSTSLCLRWPGCIASLFAGALSLRASLAYQSRRLLPTAQRPAARGEPGSADRRVDDPRKLPKLACRSGDRTHNHLDLHSDDFLADDQRTLCGLERKTGDERGRADTTRPPLDDRGFFARSCNRGRLRLSDSINQRPLPHPESAFVSADESCVRKTRYS